MSHAGVAILDFGSQYTQLIARRVRELEIYSVILPADVPFSRLQEMKPKAVVLSGGPASVYSSTAPKITKEFFDWAEKEKVAVLGVCYGLQLMASVLGGKIKRADRQEYGRQQVTWKSKGGSFQAWMSHGDEMEGLPSGFKLLAESESGTPAVVEDTSRKFLGLQFHPEVTHTEGGTELLGKFLRDTAGITPDWKMSEIEKEQIEAIRARVQPGQKVLCGLSGGVDSAVAATLVHKAIGDQLQCVFVDNGLLRYEERERVLETFRKELNLPVEWVDASKRFLGALQGVEDPEKKRKIIGELFIRVFEEFSKEADFLVQGTLYPDVIESSASPQDAGLGFSSTIKSHHNVGGLPKDMRLQLIEPLRDLFKDEVRTLGAGMGVPRAFLARHPFPGPGLAVRVLGDITEERLDILRRADEVYIQSIREAGLYDEIWQAFAVFLPVKSVGVQGDSRTHKPVIGLRAVTSHDGMTADWYPFPSEFLAKVSNRICNEVHEVGRVVYDISSKPPATIEWE